MHVFAAIRNASRIRRSIATSSKALHDKNSQVFQAIAGYLPLDVARRCFRNHCYESVNFLLVPRTTRDKPAGAQGHAD
jgi:hypothetical protein